MRVVKKEKTRASATMTEAQFISFVKGHLRRASRWWKPISDTIKDARVAKGVYLCNGCKQHVTKSVVIDGKRTNNIFCDHVDPIVSVEDGFTSWDNFVENLFCESQNLQVLCKSCHEGVKSGNENIVRGEISALRKKYPREYQSWSNMNSRCYDPDSTGFEYYGERGVTVQDSWKRGRSDSKGFKNFLSDMGERPEGYTLDRIDTEGNYEKENCRWASSDTQANNKTNNHYIGCNGETLTLSQWATKVGIDANTILYRIRRGWSVKEALGLVEREKPFVSKLPKEVWEEIQHLRWDGYTTVELGKMFDIDPSQVSRRTTAKTKTEREIAKSKKKDQE